MPLSGERFVRFAFPTNPTVMSRQLLFCHTLTCDIPRYRSGTFLYIYRRERNLPYNKKCHIPYHTLFPLHTTSRLCCNSYGFRNCGSPAPLMSVVPLPLWRLNSLLKSIPKRLPTPRFSVERGIYTQPFAYDHSFTLDANLQGVHEQLSDRNTNTGKWILAMWIMMVSWMK